MRPRDKKMASQVKGCFGSFKVYMMLGLTLTIFSPRSSPKKIPTSPHPGIDSRARRAQWASSEYREIIEGMGTFGLSKSYHQAWVVNYHLPRFLLKALNPANANIRYVVPNAKSISKSIWNLPKWYPVCHAACSI